MGTNAPTLAKVIPSFARPIPVVFDYLPFYPYFFLFGSIQTLDSKSLPCFPSKASLLSPSSFSPFHGRTQEVAKIFFSPAVPTGAICGLIAAPFPLFFEELLLSAASRKTDFWPTSGLTSPLRLVASSVLYILEFFSSPEESESFLLCPLFFPLSIYGLEKSSTQIQPPPCSRSSYGPPHPPFSEPLLFLHAVVFFSPLLI